MKLSGFCLGLRSRIIIAGVYYDGWLWVSFWIREPLRRLWIKKTLILREYGKYRIISRPDSHLDTETLNRLFSRRVSVSRWLEPYWCDIIHLVLLEDDSISGPFVWEISYNISAFKWELKQNGSVEGDRFLRGCHNVL